MAHLIHNPKVIANWKERLAYKRSRRRLSKGASYVSLLLFLLVILFKPPIAVALSTFFTLLVAVIANSYFSWSLLCPNCGKPPVSHPTLEDPEDATFCPNCMHYLTEGSK